MKRVFCELEFTDAEFAVLNAICAADKQDHSQHCEIMISKTLQSAVDASFEKDDAECRRLQSMLMNDPEAQE